MKQKSYRLTALAMSVLMLCAILCNPLTVLADTATDGQVKEAVATQTSSIEFIEKYAQYLTDNASVKYATKDINLSAVAYTSTEGADIEASGEYAEKGFAQVLKWKNRGGSVTYTFEVPENAMYNLGLTYLPLEGNGTEIELSIEIDGEFLYPNMEELKFPRMWKNKTDKRIDTLGNEIAPEQVEYGEFVTKYAKDSVGVVAEPFMVALSAGTHTITINSIYEPFALANVILAAPQNVKTYAEVKKEYEANGYQEYDGDNIVIQGEDAYLKSNNYLVSKSDSMSSDITPSNSIKTVLNYIGSSNWKTPGETLTWKVYVEKSGLYKLGYNFKQNGVINGYTYRELSIDGEIPFAEAKNIKFGYDTAWNLDGFCDDNGNPYLIYLEEGTHDITFTVTLAETADFYKRLSAIVDSIGDLYIKIIMITGETPDVNRSYELNKQIPNFEEILRTNNEALKKLADDMSVLSDSRGNQYIAALKNMSRVLENMLANPFLAHQYKNDFYSNYTTCSSWLYEMKSMPLSLDQFQFVSPSKDFTRNEIGFFENLAFGFKRFFASFSDEFSSVSSSSTLDKKIKLWVNWGRDQAMVLNNLIQESFTPEYGIGVDLELVSTGLVMGIISGNNPDLSLQLARTEPINLAMRGALNTLDVFSEENNPEKTFGGYHYKYSLEEVLERFQPTAEKPYYYKDKLYALPDTQSFYTMFIRTDIFEQLDLEIPTTWEEFHDAAKILQRNNMQVYIPYTKIAAATTVNTGIGGLHLFATFMQQNNVPLYNEAGTATTMKTGPAIDAFTQWTDLYTKYSYIKEADFYNRFRVASMPLGISPYSLYTQLNNAAPEIQGRWTIAQIPGIKDEATGKINNSISGSGTGCAIVKATTDERKAYAWEFLQWWTSEETQLTFNNNVEAILGTVARTATANVNTFKRMAWNADDMDKLVDQWSTVQELEELPGGYYTSRAVDQAFWEVLAGTTNTKDAMLEWGQVADNEIERKINEYKDTNYSD